jgi:hypothetical protein
LQSDFSKVISFLPLNSHNTQQDEPPSPYSYWLCPILPWQHLPWPKIIMPPQLPMSPSNAPGGRISLPGVLKGKSLIKKERNGAQQALIVANQL